MNADLIARIQQCPNLPSLPAVAIQVLELAASADANIAEIARVISRDPALSSKILRTVNSSFYGRSQHVNTISHALVILGLQSVKTLVLGFSLVSSLSQNKAKGFKHLDYWRRSIYSATAARIAAREIKLVQQEEAFLAALLQDLGMLVLDLVLGSQYGELCDKSPTHSDLIKVETESLGMTHATVGATLAQHWKLPPIFTTTIAASHSATDVTDVALRKIAQVVQLSGWCADVFVQAQPAAAIAQVKSFCAANYKLADADTDAMLEKVAANTKEVASLFEINIGPAADYEAILKKANETLVEITLKSQFQAKELKVQNTQLRKKATTDGLTGLDNRASFDETLARNLVAAIKNGKPLTLLMLDIDKFKAVNDQFGHPAGDQILSRLGKILKGMARQQDLAARYGGEEFAIVLPDTPRPVAAGIAEAIRRAVAGQPVTVGNQTIPITVSIGVATMETNSPIKEPAHLIKAADLAVYAAKNGGRNCVKIFASRPAA